MVLEILFKFLDFIKDEIEQKRENLLRYFQDGPGRELNLHSLYFQVL